jgi:hypothetical protein
MCRTVIFVSVLMTLVSGPARAQAAMATGSQGDRPADPVFIRAQQMVTAGQDSAGRAVVDSVLAVTTEGTPRYAEALFWRATLSATAAAAERDYRRISVEYPLSPRAPESLLRLSQLEMTRGDRASARAHLERLQREHPTGALSTRASVTLARLAFDDGDLTVGCAAVSAAREGLGAGDVELRNQIDYYARQCAMPRDTATAPAAQRTTPPRGDAAPAAEPSGRAFSVQVAAYQSRDPATALARRLTARGYAARVVGERPPYRVRVGTYATRALAADAARRMSRVNIRGVVVEAEPR